LAPNHIVDKPNDVTIKPNCQGEAWYMGKCLQIRVELDNTFVGTSESASFLETFPGVFAVVCPAW